MVLNCMQFIRSHIYLVNNTYLTSSQAVLARADLNSGTFRTCSESFGYLRLNLCSDWVCEHFGKAGAGVKT